MSETSDKAVAMFAEGYNCAQSVLVNCGLKHGLDRQTACKVAQCFGGGMCHTSQTCGAVTGALMTIGLVHAKTGPDNAPKAKANQLGQEFMRRFRAKHGQVGCTELLDCNLSTAEGMVRFQKENLRTRCEVFVRDAAEIVEELLR